MEKHESAGDVVYEFARNAGITADAPHLEIQIPLGGLPQVRLVCFSEGEERLLRGWIELRPELEELVRRSSELAERRRAA